MLKESLIITLSLLISKGLNYLYFILVGKLLSPEQYGLFYTLINLFFILTVPFTGILQSVMQNIKYLDESISKFVFIYYIRVVGKIFGIIFLLFLIFYEKISNFFNSNILWVLLVVIVTFLDSISTVSKGILLRYKKFHIYSLLLIIESVIRLPLAYILTIKYNWNGALISIFISFLIVSFLSLWFNKNIVLSRYTKKIEIEFKNTLILPIFLITIMMNSDIYFVRYFLGFNFAGLYSAASVISKVPFIIVREGISTVMFSYMLDKRKSRYEILIKSTKMLIILSPVIIIFLFPENFILIFFSGEYIYSSTILRNLLVASFAFGLSNMIILYYASVSKIIRFRFIFIFILEIFLFYMFHNSIYQISIVVLFISFISLLSLLFESYRHRPFA